MIIPIVLLLFATLAAAMMAYGMHPGWAAYNHGFEFILLSRKLQWPLVAASLLLCLILLGLVIAGRRRAWWLIGLAPILALFAHRFTSDRTEPFHVIENPPFAAAADASFLADTDWVVGVRFADQDYAYPYAALFRTPIVIHADHDRRIAILWSAYANRAIAVEVARDVRGADLEIVSTPANAMLVYNQRLGEFINGFTGRMPDGSSPTGFRDVTPTSKMTWKNWKKLHPEGLVLKPLGPFGPETPRGPILPTFAMKGVPADTKRDEQVVLIGSQHPVAIREALSAKPQNLTVDGKPVLAFRDPASGAVRAFERRIDDLRPQFLPNTDRRRPKALFVDRDTGAGWTSEGVAIDGPMEIRGKRLAPVPADDAVYWWVVKHWYPTVETHAGP